MTINYRQELEILIKSVEDHAGNWRDYHVNALEDALDRAKSTLNNKNKEQVEERAKKHFTDWFVKNYPGPDTNIYDPHWHAPKIFNNVIYQLTHE
jgi:hypothetical protein